MLALRSMFAALVILAVHSSAFAGDSNNPAGKGESEEPVILEDVVVTPRTSLLDRKVGEQLVLGSEARDLPLIDNDVFRAAQVHPGVRGGDFNASFSVRGGETDETLVLIDGVEIFRPFHLQDYGGALSAIDLLAVDKVNLLLGGFPAEYGDRLSSVLEVNLKDPSGDLEVNAGLDLLNAHVFAGVGPAFAAVRAGYIGLLMGLMQSDEKFEPHYWDVLARISCAGEGDDRVSAGLLYAGDKNRMDKAGEEDDVESLFHNAACWIRWLRRWDCGLSLDSHAYGGLYSQEREEGLTGVDDRDLSYAGVKSVLGTRYARSSEVRTGFDLRWMRGEYRYRDEIAGADFTAKPEEWSFRGFLQNKWGIAPGLETVFGTRFLWESGTASFRLAPSASVSWSPLKGLSFKAAWGRYLQPVDPLNLPVEAGESSIGRPEEAYHWVGGVQYFDEDLKINARVEAYHKDMDHLAGFVRDFGRKTQQIRPPESAKASGLEMVLDKGFGSLNLHIGYSYSEAREKSGGVEYWRDNDSRHSLNAGLSLKPGKGWSINLMWRCSTGAPYTRSSKDGDEVRYGPPNEGRLPPYHSLDLRISHDFDLGGARIQAYIQVLNLYDRKNVHEYTLAETSPGVYERRAETLFPLLPTLGINIVF